MSEPIKALDHIVQAHEKVAADKCGCGWPDNPCGRDSSTPLTACMQSNRPAAASEVVKRPTCFEYYAADLGEEIKSYFDADPVYAYMDYLESQLAAKDAEIEQLKAKLQSMSGDH